MPRFENTRPDDDEDLKSEISSNEDKNILSSVRFSRLVDSRRISKDYYALLQKEQEKYAPDYLLTYLGTYYIRYFIMYYVLIEILFSSSRPKSLKDLFERQNKPTVSAGELRE